MPLKHAKFEIRNFGKSCTQRKTAKVCRNVRVCKQGTNRCMSNYNTTRARAEKLAAKLNGK